MGWIKRILSLKWHYWLVLSLLLSLYGACRLQTINNEQLQERWLFFKNVFTSPTNIGALVPTSQKVARLMAQEARQVWQEDEWIVELGPGTGPITRALLAQGIAAEKLICIELDPVMYQYMQENFPNVTVIQGDAACLPQLVASDKHQKISAVVSGLPLTIFPSEVRQAIEEASVALLKPNGKVIQFTYRPSSPWRHQQLAGNRVATIYWNFPPATVWTYQKKIQAPQSNVL